MPLLYYRGTQTDTRSLLSGRVAVRNAFDTAIIMPAADCLGRLKANGTQQ